MNKQQIPVAERALIQRINRKLKPEGEQLRTARSQKVEQILGRYHVVDVYRHCVVLQDVDIEAMGRELEVLKPFEKVV
jgi:hypothetical protein